MKFRVVHVDGSRKGETEVFDVPSLSVGRDPSNVLAFDPLKDDRVSTRHATIAEQGGAVVLTDLGSKNGTIVNGQKVQGSMPIASGALVQFGDKGPMVTVHFELAAPAPAAASPAPAPAAQPKKGGKGCLIAVVVVVLLCCLAGAVVVGLIYVGGSAAKERLEAEKKKLEDEIEKKKKEAEEAAKKGGGSSGKTEGPPVVDTGPWAKVGVGSVFDRETITHTEDPPTDVKQTQRLTVVAKDARAITLRYEETSNGQAMTPYEVPSDIAEPLDKAPRDAETKDDQAETPAGKFDCRYSLVKGTVDGSVTEKWIAKDFPVAVKIVVTAPGKTTTTLLKKIERK